MKRISCIAAGDFSLLHGRTLYNSPHGYPGSHRHRKGVEAQHG